jgi:hypothetical protein
MVSAHIQEIVDASMLTEQEKEWMEEYASQSLMHHTHDVTNSHVERVIMPNLFDMRARDRQPVSCQNIVARNS